MSEIWLQYKDTPYEISSAGRVRRGIKILSPRKHTHGYLRVTFCIKNKREDKYIHRLVCETFHGPAPEEGMHADQKNKIRDDNDKGNLRWLTPDENRKERSPPKGERNPMAKLSYDDVKAIRNYEYFRGVYSKLSRKFGVDRKTIKSVMRRETWA